MTAKIKLPKAPNQYSVNDEQASRRIIEQASETLIGNKDYASTTKSGVVKVDGSTLQVSSGVASVIPPQSNAGGSASPSGNVSTTEKAMGLGLVSGFSITPATSGKVFVLISGNAQNTTAGGDGITVRGRYGTGTAPNNGATSGLGTQFSIDQREVAATTAGKFGFSVHAIISGLTVGTAYWFDLSIVAVTAGGASVFDCQCSVMEIR